MASETLMCFLLMLSYVHVGESTDSLFQLTCQPAVGVIGQTTHISCSTESQKKPVINAIILTRIGEKSNCYTYQPFENKRTGDIRFNVINEPSLELHKTAISDEGEYKYFIRTDMGQGQAKFTINVTAAYSDPIITSMPEEIVNDRPADLYCKASGGYPAGTIHWFDQANTNWTKNAELQITQGDDGLFTLFSKLSFKKIDSVWANFRCVILNNRYEEEGGITSVLEIKDDKPVGSPVVSSTVTNSIAGVVVIGSLIIGLLVALLFKQRRNWRPFPKQHVYNEEDIRDLNEPVYKNAVGGEENVEV